MLQPQIGADSWPKLSGDGSKMVNKLQLTPHGWMASDPPKSATK